MSLSMLFIIIIISVPDCGSPEGEGRPGMHCKKIHAQVFLSSCHLELDPDLHEDADELDADLHDDAEKYDADLHNDAD